MEKRKLTLLRYLLNNCDSGYKVIDVEKIVSAIKKYKRNFALLNEDIQYLSQHKYIDVKYIDELNICLSILDNTHVFQDNIKSDRSINRRYIISLLISMLFSGVMAFVGAFLAILLTR